MNKVKSFSTPRSPVSVNPVSQRGVVHIQLVLKDGIGELVGPKHQWLFLVPLKGGIGDIVHPPIGKDYKWYISGIFPANWRIICYRSHLLGEPKTTIENSQDTVKLIHSGMGFGQILENQKMVEISELAKWFSMDFLLVISEMFLENSFNFLPPP